MHGDETADDSAESDTQEKQTGIFSCAGITEVPHLGEIGTCPEVDGLLCSRITEKAYHYSLCTGSVNNFLKA